MEEYRHQDSPQERGFVQRMGRRARVLTVVVVLSLLAVGVYLFLHSDFYTVKRVAIEGNTVVSDEEIMARLPQGANIFDLDTDEAAAELTRHPYIASAVIEKDYPDGMIVRIDERTPACWLAEGPLTLLADDGTVLPSGIPGGGFDLPVITEYEVERLTPLQRYSDPAILAACTLCAEMQCQGLPIYKELVELRPRRDFLEGVLTDGRKVLFPADTTPAVLAAVQAVYSREIQTGFGELDARYSGQVVARDTRS